MLYETVALDGWYQATYRLNPCFNGICSMSPTSNDEAVIIFCLNPCFNGICSMSLKNKNL